MLSSIPNKVISYESKKLISLISGSFWNSIDLTFTVGKYRAISSWIINSKSSRVESTIFSNNNDLSSKIEKAGEKVGEKVWRLPLHENYDKLMNSPVADIQNINYAGGAGSITAAQFLQRFILNKTPWAHLDLAGMAFSKKAANLNPGGATGFGVRLSNNFIEENYE